MRVAASHRPGLVARTVLAAVGLMIVGLLAAAASAAQAAPMIPANDAISTASASTTFGYDGHLAVTAATTKPSLDAAVARPALRTVPWSSTASISRRRAAKGGKLPWAGHRPYAPNRELPRYPSGRPKPESPYPHTQLRRRKGRYPQSREFDENGRPVRDIDWTDHGRPDWHTDPHQHLYGPDGSRGGPGSVWP